MESKRLIISIYNISEYLYCQKSCFYKIFKFEEDQDNNVDIINGREAHYDVDKPSVKYNKNNIKRINNLKIFSNKYNIVGKLDLLEIDNLSYYPIEYKKGCYRDFLNHKIQLTLEALCLEEMYNTDIDYGFLFFTEEQKRYKIYIDDDLRFLSISIIDEINRKILKNDSNLFLKNTNSLCYKCSYFSTCLPFLNYELYNR